MAFYPDGVRRRGIGKGGNDARKFNRE